MVELWVSFWLWIAGGTASASMWMIFASAIIAASVMVTPVLLLARNTKRDENGKIIDEGWRWSHVPLMLGGIALFFGGLMLAGFLGIIGVSEYHANFRHCVQTYDVANIREDIDAVTVHTLHCRERAHINDEWSAFSVAGVQQQPYINAEFVDFLD